MINKLLLTVLCIIGFARLSFSQSFFSTSTYANDPKGVGANNLYGWGENFDRTIDVRPNPHPWMGTMMINYHTGLTFSAHSVYGGIRFYNQGYPNPYDPATGSVMAMSITNGKVGVGTTDPTAALTVNGDFKIANGDNLFAYNGAADITFRYAGRGSGGRAIVHDTNNRLTLNFGGDFTGGTSIGTNVYFSENTAGTSYIYGGSFALGTSDAKGYRLAVAGNAIAESMTVKLSANWPDYVFDGGYYLTPLSDLKAYINQNHRLPEMPSDKEALRS